MKNTLENHFGNSIVTTYGYEPALHHKVLKGELVAYIAKNVISKNDCHQIVQAFAASAHKDRYSVTPVIEKIGNPIFLGGKEHIQNYFDNAKLMQSKIDEVYLNAETQNYPRTIFETLKEYLKKESIEARPIQNKDKSGIFGILRSWGSANEPGVNYATPIHEDKLQLRLHEGVETKKALNSILASTCFYYSNGNNLNDGKLTIYDIKLKEEDAVNERSGAKGEYGYDEEYVKGKESITICPETGDVVTFAADYLHMVHGISQDTRITASYSTAIIDNDNLCLVWS